MDLDEWELLSDEGFIDLHEDQGVDKSKKPNLKNTTMIDMDYFQKFSEPEKGKSLLRVIPVPIKFDDDQEEEEIPEELTIKLPIIESSQEKSDDDHQMKKDQNFGVLGQKSSDDDDDHDDQEMVSTVSFKKLKENEFVDMKMDSPRSLNRGILPQIDVGSYQFDQKVEKDCNFEKKNEEDDEKMVVYEEKSTKMEEGDENGGVNIWKWAMTGMGALVTFGFAAATVSLIVFSNRHKDSNHSKKQELHFQIYSHDKRFKQVVRRAQKLNEAITVMRGAPITRAHITIGGYYEGL